MIMQCNQRLETKYVEGYGYDSQITLITDMVEVYIIFLSQFACVLYTVQTECQQGHHWFSIVRVI